MFSTGKASITYSDILSRVSECDILNHYLGISELPTTIHSPLRLDSSPSFGLYLNDNNKVHYKDFSNGDSGGLLDLLMKYWGKDYTSTIEKIYNDLPSISSADINASITRPNGHSTVIRKVESELKCKVREWRSYDIEYWASYGISLKWLKYADIYPISHKIVIKNGYKYVFGVDKYAYAYVERKEGKVTLKIYQPLTKDKRRKWYNKHDRSVISLWTKVPEYGEQICICSSMKDALCLWANTDIPAIAIQGEGYGISDTAANELRRRFKHIYILLDNDEPGLKDAEKLASETGFTNIVLPPFEGGKDISDYYKSLKDKSKFKETILNLFDYGKKATVC